MGIKINKERCSQIGRAIKDIKIKFDIPAIKNDTDRRYETLLWLVFAAICQAINSDYLLRRLRSIPRDKFNAEHLQEFDAEKMKKLLSGYDKPEKIRAEERARFLQDLCSKLIEQYDADVLKFVGDGVVGGKRGFLKRLDLFDAFREDPLRKKSNILIQSLHLNKLVKFKDLGNCSPAIDYHLIRLALRNGQIIINDRKIDGKVLNQEEITSNEDTKIREAVVAAFRLVSESSVPIPELNWIEWHIARSFCLRENPLCRTDANPLDKTLVFDFKHRCPLYDACEKKIKYLEPKFKTTFY